MSRGENKKFIFQTFIQLFLTGIVVYFVQKYYDDRLAKKRLKQEIYNTAKRDAFGKAIEIAYRRLATIDYKGVDIKTGKSLPLMQRNRGAIPPNELEMNTAFSKLYLYSSDTQVLNSYYRLMVTPDDTLFVPILEMKRFLDAVSIELDNPDRKNKPTFPYILSDTTKRL